jgi:hypothetical protein
MDWKDLILPDLTPAVCESLYILNVPQEMGDIRYIFIYQSSSEEWRLLGCYAIWRL